MIFLDTEVKKINPLGTEKISKLLVKFAVPSIIAMLVSATYNIVDQIFIGQSVGYLGNAATNVAFPLVTICTAMALLFGIGGAANFNLSMGAGRKDEAAKYAGNAVSMMLLVGVVYCLVVRVFLEPVLNICGATPDVMQYAMTYTSITSYGFPFLIFSTGAGAMIRADGSPRFSMFCLLSGAILNTILDPIFIFPMGMGIAGAAWATVIGQILSAAIGAFYMFRKFKTVKLKKHDFVPSFRHVCRLAALGAANCFNQLAMMIVQITLNNVLRSYGAMSVYGSEIPLAVSGIVSKVNMIFFSIIIGLSQGFQPIASYNYGAKQFGRVREAYRLTLTIGFTISVVAFLGFQFFPREIISIFGPGSEEYFHFAEQYFRIFLFFTFLNCLQPVTTNLFSSIGRASRGVFLSLTRQIIFLLPLILILPAIFGIDGVMFAAPIADAVAAVCAIALASIEFRKMKKAQFDLEHGIDIPKDLYSDPDPEKAPIEG